MRKARTDPDQQYFAGGVTDDFTTDLSRITKHICDLAQHRIHLSEQTG